MTGDGSLRTERLLLRRFHEHDAAALVALDSDPEVVRYNAPARVHAPPTLEEVRQGEMARILAGYDRVPPEEAWAALRRPGGDFAGGFFLVREPDAETWAVSCRIRRALWGMGLAAEGAEAVIRHAFDAHDAARVVTHVSPEDEAGRRAVRELGMRRVGPARRDGADVVLYERRRS